MGSRRRKSAESPGQIHLWTDDATAYEAAGSAKRKHTAATRRKAVSELPVSNNSLPASRTANDHAENDDASPPSHARHAAWFPPEGDDGRLQDGRHVTALIYRGDDTWHSLDGVDGADASRPAARLPHDLARVLYVNRQLHLVRAVGYRLDVPPAVWVCSGPFPPGWQECRLVTGEMMDQVAERARLADLVAKSPIVERWWALVAAWERDGVWHEVAVTTAATATMATMAAPAP